MGNINPKSTYQNQEWKPFLKLNGKFVLLRFAPVQIINLKIFPSNQINIIKRIASHSIKLLLLL